MTFQTLGAKDPNATVAYQLDWTAYFTDADDQLDSADVQVVNEAGAPIASDLQIVAQQNTFTGIVTWWLAGGTPGATYRVRVTVRGANATPVRLVDCRTVIIPCRQH